MKVTFGQQTTKVKQLADTLSQAISMNEFKAGDSLPSINQLSDKYGVSRDTVFKAFLNLRERGLVDATPGKGYYVMNRLTNVLLLLDQYSPFKDIFYNSFIKRLHIDYKVDLLFHQYNEHLFNTIISESSGRYNKYVVMNFDNERFSKNLCKIDKNKLLLLDFGKFDKNGYSYICQDFDEGFYDSLFLLKGRLERYHSLVLVFPPELKHPQSAKAYFDRFCREQGFLSEIIESPEDIILQSGSVYVAIKQEDIVSIVKQGRAQGLKCGKDFGILAYNDIPSYEVIDEGITALSIDWKRMGHKAAEFVLYNTPIQEYLPTEVRLRNSL